MVVEDENAYSCVEGPRFDSNGEPPTNYYLPWR